MLFSTRQHHAVRAANGSHVLSENNKGTRVDEQLEARALVQQLSSLEREALLGLMNGESVRDFARRFAMRGRKAADIRRNMKCKLGVIRDADAVRIGLIAEIGRKTH
jgi:DNA-binding CsgD family transcriptional regulator